VVDKVSADEAGCACDEDHVLYGRMKVAIFAIVTHLHDG